MDDIFIYIEEKRQGHVDNVWWVLDILKKNGLYANLKKCHFHKDTVCFLDYVVLDKGIEIKDKRIEVVNNWLYTQ